MTKSLLIASLIATLGLAACGKKEEMPAPAPAPVAAPAPAPAAEPAPAPAADAASAVETAEPAASAASQ